MSVNERLMRLYQPYTAFIIVPVFALANAGVPLTAETLRASLTSPLTWGVVLGLVLGKFVGITAATALFARLRPGSLAPGLRIPRSPAARRCRASGSRSRCSSSTSRWTTPPCSPTRRASACWRRR